MIGIATQAQDDVNYDISTTPATEVVEGHMYVLQNRKYTEIGLAYDGFGATTFDPVSDQLGQFVTSVQNFFFTAGEDGFTLPVTLENINDVNIDWGYGETGGGTVLSPKRKAADNTVYFTVKDAAGQYVMLYNSALHGVNATTPAPEAQWIAYEVKEHEHKWAPNEDRTHYCTVCSVEEEEHSYIDGVCEICQHECEHSSYYDGACEYCGAECEHNNGWEFIEGDDYFHYCSDCGHPERHLIAEDDGACDCGFICPGHDYFVNDMASVLATKEQGESIMVYECINCHYQKTMSVETGGECEGNESGHEWDEDKFDPTCAMPGYTVHHCYYCNLVYYTDFTDTDPDNHFWYADSNGHFCNYSCAEHGASLAEHTMEEGKCTICGYWPGHTEHQWLTDDSGHFCTIPGCEYGGYDYHTMEEGNCACTVCGHIEHQYENGVCQNCGTGCQHEWNDGYCYICHTVCDHTGNIVPAAAIPATCTKGGWKEHFECSVCHQMFANEEGEDIGDYYEDFVIEKLGHDIGDDLCCRREGCEAKVTISSTEITLGEAAYVDFMDYSQNLNSGDPTAEPLYKIVVETTPALYSLSIPESIAEQLDSPGVSIFDKNFEYFDYLSFDPEYDNSAFFEEVGTYYLLPSAFGDGEKEFVKRNVPLTIAIVNKITLDEDITDENGEPVVLTLTEDGSYATEQTIALDDDMVFYYDYGVEFSVPEVSYTRELSAYTGNNWGTLCLPFDYTVAEAEAAGLNIYEFTAASAEAVTVTRKTEGTVKYGTPVLFKKTGVGATFTLSATNTKMGFDEGCSATMDGLRLWGVVLSEVGVDSGYYLDATDGKLHSIEDWCSEQGEDYLHIPAYRAYFDQSYYDGFEARLNVIVDDETTALDAIRALTQGNARIYGLDGKKRSDLQKGVNIVNGRKVIVK